MDYRRISLALAALTSLACGCDFGGACDDIAVGSVSLEVVDAQTEEAIEMPTITFTVDGDPEVRPPADGYDGRFVLTYEETGTFEVSVSAEGYAESMRTYEVVLDEDGCHPVGQSDVIALEPAP